MSRIKQPAVDFFSLSREIRQMILLNTFTNEDFEKDKTFNSRLIKLPYSILVKIIDYAADTDPGLISVSAYHRWQKMSIINRYGFIPVHIIEIAKGLSA